MSRPMLLVIAALMAVACVADPPPTASPGPSFLPLPESLGLVPGVVQPMTEIAPHSLRGELKVGVERNYPLPHCGLNSPIDIDGNLWEPIGAHNGNGGPLTEAQIGDLINPTATVVVLTSAELLQMRTPTGALVLLARHDGPREYIGCD